MDMKFAIIEQDARVLEILIQNLRSEFSAEVSFYNTPQDFFTDLVPPNLPSLIIVRNNLGEDASAKILINGLYDKSFNIPVIVLGEVELVGMKYETLPTKFRIEQLYRKVISLLNLSKEDLKEIALPDYIPLPIHYFFTMQNSPCDIFISIKKQLEISYIKRINANEEFDKESIMRYHDKYGLKTLFIRKEDRHLFMNALIDQSVSQMKSPALNLEEKLERASDFFDTNASEIIERGLDEYSVKMVEGTLTTMTATITTQSKLGQLLKSLMSAKGSYAYKRANLMALFSYNTIPYIDWGPTSAHQGIFEKFVFISFFHDIHLKDHPHLHKIHTREEFLKSSLTEADKKLLLNHANTAATLVQSFPKAPLGVDVIIRQHHATSNGIGFPENFSSALSPMAILIIILEDFVVELLKPKEERLPLKDILALLDAKYPLPSYRKALTALKTTLTKNF